MASLVFAGQTGPSFPAVVKRLNMLRPARYPRTGEAGPGDTTYVAAWSKADYLRDWLPFNLADEGGADTDTTSFGSFTTAPDSTTDTARLLVESSDNSEHSAVAGWGNVDQWCYGKVRLAKSFKYAGRRVKLEIVTSPRGANGAGKSGCKAVFDLLNGRVAVDTVAFGTPQTAWTLYPAKIAHMGGGWYLCWIEAIAYCDASGMAPGLFGKVSLDNGVGLAPESTTYTGDGSSGVYGWRSNMLPSRAWNLGSVALFDDFDDATMANCDLANSKAGGFTWYLNNAVPSYGAFDPTPANALSVSGSVLTIATAPQPLALATFASTWDRSGALSSGYAGRGWVPSALFECRAKWDISLSNQNDATAFWTASLEWLTGGRSQNLALPGLEIDFFEALHGSVPKTHVILYDAGADFVTHDIAHGWSSIGLEAWNSGHTYGTGTGVTDGGSKYMALRATTGEVPASSPTAWDAYDQKNGQAANYQAGVDYPAGDYTNLHDYATLWLPYDAATGEPGQIVQFYDGVMCAFPLTYGPGLTGRNQSSVVHQTDAHQFPVLLGCGPDMGISVDWVRVTQ